MPSTEVLVVTIAIMFVVIIWLISQIKRKDNERSLTNTHNVVEPVQKTVKFDPTVIEKRRIEVQRDPKNPQYIERVKSFLNYEIDKFSELGCFNLHPFATQYANLLTYIEQIEGTWTSKHMVEVMDMVKLNECRVATEKAYSELGEDYVALYNDIISGIKELYSESLIDGFMLNDDKATAEKQKLFFALKQDLGAYYASFSGLQATHGKLKAMLPNCIEIMNKKGWDWGDFFKGAAGGAIAVVNPLIGIPVILANLFGADNKQKKENSYLEEVSKLYDEYWAALDDVESNMRDVCYKQGAQMKKLMTHLYLQNVVVIMNKLDEKGLSLKGAVTYYESRKKDIESYFSEE